MPYVRSAYRREFEDRVNFLIKKARRAQRLRKSDTDIRDLVFQSTIFLTCAGIETYTKLLIEAWLQKVVSNGRVSSTPEVARAFIASKRLEGPFAKYYVQKDEKELCLTLKSEVDLWPFLSGGASFPQFFKAAMLHDGTTYPSLKNVKRLFARVGIEDMQARLNRNLRRDVDVLIENFQSVRTALAHSSPPTIAITDVEKLLTESKSFIGAVDRIFHSHVVQHCGADCWTV